MYKSHQVAVEDEPVAVYYGPVTQNESPKMTISLVSAICETGEKKEDQEGGPSHLYTGCVS